MSTIRRFTFILSCLSLVLLGLPLRPAAWAQAQQASASAMDRGYRTGYSDGYQVGFRDSNNQSTRDYANNEDYRRADRAYLNSYGPVEDYRDGYRQGFEAGYNAAYDHRTFDSTIPQDLHRRGTQSSGDNSTPAVGDTSTPSVAGPPQSLPPNSILTVQLLSNITTDVSQQGDPFDVKVVDPMNLSGAMIHGHIAQLKRPGRVKGNAELQLSFDQIRLPNGRSAAFNAQVLEVLETGVSQTGSVDPEGGVKGRDSTKDDVAKVGAAGGIGAIIGAIAGGGKGAAIGAAIGGGAATGGVLATRGKDLRLRQGQQLRIQTATETRF